MMWAAWPIDTGGTTGDMIRKSLAAAGLSLVCAGAAAQHVAIVTVTGTGYGKTEAEAIADAVINGIAQVNGESVAASMRMKKSTSESASGDQASRSASRSIEEDISRRTQGVVKSWQKISAQMSPAGDSAASVSVNVVVLKRSAQLDRLKIAVVPSGKGDAGYTNSLTDELTQNLTGSRKFSVMDRRNNKEIADQLARIRRGNGVIEDKVRLTGEVAPDVLAVVTVEPPVSRPNGKTYLYGSLEVIDYSSRQIKFFERKMIPIKQDDDASNRRRIAILGKGLSRAVIQTAYPPTVVGHDSESITIGQGSDFFAMGDKLVVRRMGKAVRDPHTGEFLSYEQTDVGRAEITYIDARLAKAKLLGPVSLDHKGVLDKKYQVWRTGESANDIFGSLTSDESPAASKGKAKKIFVTDDDDDDDD